MPTYSVGSDRNITPEFYIDALEQSTLSNVSREMQEWLDWNWTNTATYSDTFASKHNLNIMGGFTAERFASFDRDYTQRCARQYGRHAESKCRYTESER